MLEHYVQRVLGHANIKTTSTYLASTDEGLEEYFALRAEAPRAREAGTSVRDARRKRCTRRCTRRDGTTGGVEEC